EVLEEKDAFADAHYRTFREDILPTGRAEPRFPPVVYKAVSDALQAVQLAGADAAEEAARAQKTIESYLETYRGGSRIRAPGHSPRTPAMPQPRRSCPARLGGPRAGADGRPAPRCCSSHPMPWAC